VISAMKINIYLLKPLKIVMKIASKMKALRVMETRGF